MNKIEGLLREISILTNDLEKLKVKGEEIDGSNRNLTRKFAGLLILSLLTSFAFIITGEMTFATLLLAFSLFLSFVTAYHAFSINAPPEIRQKFEAKKIELGRVKAKLRAVQNTEKQLKKEKMYQENLRREAENREMAKDYDSAIKIWEELGQIKEAARVRTLKIEQGSVKVAQKVVHGDEVTEIKDSVLNRSNVGGKSSKTEELREAKSLLDEGLINEDDYEKMKKEILGK